MEPLLGDFRVGPLLTKAILRYGSVRTLHEDAFDLSADRANAVRQILQREGLPASHVFAVSGKADTLPLFPDDPSLAANRRVTITLMREDPPLPPNFKP